MMAQLELGNFGTVLGDLEEPIKTLESKLWWASRTLISVRTILLTVINAGFFAFLFKYLAVNFLSSLFVSTVSGASLTIVEELLGLTTITDEAIATILSKIAYNKRIWLAGGFSLHFKENLEKMHTLSQSAIDVVEKFLKTHSEEEVFGNNPEHWKVFFDVMNLFDKFMESAEVVKKEIKFLNDGE